MTNRRDFLKLLGGALLLPYVPRVIYSFPTPKVEVVPVFKVFERHVVSYADWQSVYGLSFEVTQSMWDDPKYFLWGGGDGETNP